MGSLPSLFAQELREGQNYVRAETIAAANARLVDHHATLALTRQWGGGDVASADGLRFVVPVRTINAGPNPRYFGTGRGITYLNFTSDQFTGFSGLVIPGTLRDSIYILEGLLQNETSLRPVQIMTDHASYSDLVFGLFRLLGYQFSPRLADLGNARLWRLDPGADYGALNAIARHLINAKLIRMHWHDMLRVAGSLAFGTVNAIELVRTLQGGGRPTTLGRAIAEYGRLSRRCTCSTSSTTRATAARCSSSSIVRRVGIRSLGSPSTARGASSAKPTGRGRKISLAPWGSS
jgi:TnpA family transposase